MSVGARETARRFLMRNWCCERKLGVALHHSVECGVIGYEHEPVVRILPSTNDNYWTGALLLQLQMLFAT